MTCVKTGAEIYLEEYQEWCRGDVHQVGDVRILRINPMSIGRESPSRVHCRVAKIDVAWPSSPRGAADTWTVVCADRHAIFYGTEGRPNLKSV